MNRIDLWCKSLREAFKSTGEIAPWPMHIGAVAPYFTDIEARDIFDKLKNISKEKNAHEIVSKLLISSSVAKTLLMDFIVGMKVAKPKISTDERVWFVNYWFNVMSEMQTGDIFCLDGKNLMLSDLETTKIMNETPWIDVKNKDFVQSLYKLSASTKSLIWSLYFYGWDDIGYEIHGPYKVADKNGNKLQLVVTDYFDIKPSTLWPSMQNSPYRSIKLYSLFKESAKLSVDIFCHFTNGSNMLESTAGIYLEVDDKPIKESEVTTVTKNILDRVLEQHSLIKTMSKKDVIKKYIESRYYAFRRWREYFAEDWYPPKVVLDRIKDWKTIEIPSNAGPSEKDLIKAFDPRTDYVPSN